MSEDRPLTGSARDVPVDWEALEDAFENNAPEVHSYFHLSTGEVLRVVDGVADPQMHSRISVDPNYLRIEPVSSREQYRWMERFIPLVDDNELRTKLAHAIDGKGAFRRFKDVLMSFAAERERWFTFRSERLRTFMEAWLNAHAMKAAERPTWADGPPSGDESMPDSLLGPFSQLPSASSSLNSLNSTDGSLGAMAVAVEAEGPRSQSGRRQRNAETLRQHLRELGDSLGPRELDLLVSFAEFLRARRAARGFAHHHEHMREERETSSVQSQRAPRSSDSPVAGMLAAESKGNG
ncbi:MAG: UPF0158 family protein [Polyangiaceae bacterium]|nr:UPF0158 family protein [Polyangiaceae bacterium]